MDETPRYHSVGRLIFGLTVLAFGVLFLLSNLNIIESSDYLRYWPLILVAFGLSKLLRPRESGGHMFGFILVLAGGLLLLRTFGKIHFTLWDFWPVLLVLLGFSIIWGAFGRRSYRGRYYCGRGRASVVFNDKGDPPRVDSDSTIDVNTIFGGSERIVTSQDFRGGTISTIMGGCDVDLRGAAMQGPEAVIDISAVFGGVEIRVPEEWKVVVRTSAVLGGVDDKTRKPVADGSKTLVVAGRVVFGGIEIRN